MKMKTKWILMISVWVFLLSLNIPVHSMFMGPGGVNPEEERLTLSSQEGVASFHSTAVSYISPKNVKQVLDLKIRNFKAKKYFKNDYVLYKKVTITKKTNGKKEKASRKDITTALQTLMTEDEETIYKKYVLSAVSPYTGKLDESIFKTDTFRGASDGLMMSLQIVQTVTKEDLAKDRKIAGTGWIDKDGNIGSIAGLEEKITSAYFYGIDLFFVPKSQYEEAVYHNSKLKKPLKLVPVSTLDEAINYLRK